MSKWQAINIERTKWEMLLPGFRLVVEKNMSGAIRFQDLTAPSWNWRIERLEFLPSGEELTMEEAMNVVQRLFRERTGCST